MNPLIGIFGVPEASVSFSHNLCWFLQPEVVGLLLPALPWAESSDVELSLPWSLSKGACSLREIQSSVGPAHLCLWPFYLYHCGFLIPLVLGLMFSYISGILYYGRFVVYYNFDVVIRGSKYRIYVTMYCYFVEKFLCVGFL